VNIKIFNKKALHLLELLIVTFIIGVLASIAMPMFFKAIESSRQAEAVHILSRLYKGYREITLIDHLMVFDTDQIADPNEWVPGSGDFTFEIGIGGGSNTRRDASFYYLGFDENINTVTHYRFAYFYSKSGNNGGSLQGLTGAPDYWWVPDDSPVFCAARKKEGENNPPTNVGSHLETNKYICIYCTNGTIYRNTKYYQ